MAVDKYVYLSKAVSPLVEVWDKKSERMVDSIDCARIIRYTHTHTLLTIFHVSLMFFGVYSFLEDPTCRHFVSLFETEPETVCINVKLA